MSQKMSQMNVQKFTFNPFEENTYVLYDDSGECAIVDPGCYNEEEQKVLTGFIEDHDLKPVILLNTHCHLDHIFANRHISEKYGLGLHAHEEESIVLHSAPKMAHLYGLDLTPSPDIAKKIDEGEQVSFGKTSLDIVFTPGHSPGSVCFLEPETRVVIAGDVLFLDSIGRTDLPGGDHDTLLRSIRDKLLPLEDEWKVYCGHGPDTTIGRERRYNPFVRGLA